MKKIISHSYRQQQSQQFSEGPPRWQPAAGRMPRIAAFRLPPATPAPTVRTTATALRTRTATVSATTAALLQGRMLRMQDSVVRAAVFRFHPTIPAPIVRTTATALQTRTATVSATTAVLLQGRMLRMRNRILRAAAPPLPAAITWSETTVPAADITPAPVLLTDRQPPFCRKNRQHRITILRIGKRRHAK